MVSTPTSVFLKNDFETEGKGENDWTSITEQFSYDMTTFWKRGELTFTQMELYIGLSIISIKSN